MYLVAFYCTLRFFCIYRLFKLVFMLSVLYARAYLERVQRTAATDVSQDNFRRSQEAFRYIMDV